MSKTSTPITVSPTSTQPKFKVGDKFQWDSNGSYATVISIGTLDSQPGPLRYFVTITDKIGQTQSLAVTVSTIDSDSKYLKIP